MPRTDAPSLGERIYASLQRIALPEGFHDRHGVAMRQVFRDQLRAERTPLRRARLWATSLLDLLRTRSRLRRDLRRPSAQLPARETPVFETLLQDLRYALRALVASPGTTAIAALTLMLGIGVNVLMFSLVDGVLLKPLPLRDSERLVSVWEKNLERGWQYFTVSPLNFIDLRDQATTLAAMAGGHGSAVNLTGDGDPERLEAFRVSENFFEVTGMDVDLGRGFVDAEHRSGAGNVVVLSAGLWNRRFGSDPEIVGRSILLDGEAVQVVGVVTDPLAVLPSWAEVWLPVDMDAALEVSRGAHYWNVYGRLDQGATVEQASAEVEAIAERLPLADRGWSARAESLRDDVVDEAGQSLLLLFGAVGLVLLIACVNVANLLLVRSADRAGEMSLRCALGASRGRIARQVLTEALLLALLGTALALPMAYAGLALVQLLPGGAVPRLQEVAIDGRALGFGAAIAVLTSLLFGLVPAIQSMRLSPARNLPGSAGSTEATHRSRVRAALVVGEVAVAVVVVIAAGLLGRSLLELGTVDPGFEVESRLVARMSLSSSEYGEDATRVRFWDDLLETMRAVPGVSAVTTTAQLPLGGTFNINFSVVGRDSAAGELNAEVRVVDPSYFDALGIPLLAGRGFDERDLPGGEQTLVVNEAFVDTFFPDGGALGAVLNAGFAQVPEEEGGPILRRIVGVVGNTREFGLAREAPPVYYANRRQIAPRTMTIVLHTTGEPTDLLSALRARVAEFDPQLPLFDIRSLADHVAGDTAPERFRLILIGSFAALALALAALGIYGTVAFTVARRTREIGVRMAIGARPQDIRRLVVRGGLLPVLAGLLLGTAASLAMGRLLASQLFAIRASDPTTFAAVLLFLLAVATIACWIPARRAMRTDLVTSLRSD